MTTKTAPKAFKWNEENAKVVCDAYLTKVDSDGELVANGNAYLEELGRQVGAPSARSVRQKLAQCKVYIKADKPSTAGTTGTTRQKKLILASMIGDEIVKKDPTVGDAAQEIFGSLENAGRPALLALLALLQGRPIGSEDLEA